MHIELSNDEFMLTLEVKQILLIYFLCEQLKCKKRLLLSCIHHFKSDLIHNMDHMRISGTEPSSVILSQKVVSKVGKRCPKSAPPQKKS